MSSVLYTILFVNEAQVAVITLVNIICVVHKGMYPHQPSMVCIPFELGVLILHPKNLELTSCIKLCKVSVHLLTPLFEEAAPGKQARTPYPTGSLCLVCVILRSGSQDEDEVSDVEEQIGGPPNASRVQG